MIFRLLFIGTLAPAVLLGFRRGGQFRFTAIVLLISFALSFQSWGYSNPAWANAIGDLICAALIGLFCRERTPILIGIFFAVSAHISIIYGIAVQPQMGYGALYAHTLSAIGHLQNVALVIGAADGGLRSWIGDKLRSMVGPMVSGRFSNRAADPRSGGEEG